MRSFNPVTLIIYGEIFIKKHTQWPSQHTLSRTYTHTHRFRSTPVYCDQKAAYIKSDVKPWTMNKRIPYDSQLLITLSKAEWNLWKGIANHKTVPKANITVTNKTAAVAQNNIDFKQYVLFEHWYFFRNLHLMQIFVGLYKYDLMMEVRMRNLRLGSLWNWIIKDHGIILDMNRKACNSFPPVEYLHGWCRHSCLTTVELFKLWGQE